MKVVAVLVAVLALAPGALAGGYRTVVLPALPGPAFPSSSFADPAQQPRLVVDYMSG